MPDEHPSVVRILHMADLHLGHTDAAGLRDKYVSSLPWLLRDLRKQDVQTAKRLSPDRRVDAFISLYDHLVRAGSQETREDVIDALAAIPGCSAPPNENLRRVFGRVYSGAIHDALSNSNYTAAKDELRNNDACVKYLRDSFNSVAALRCPIDIVVVAGDLIDKGYELSEADYEARVTEAIDFVAELADDVLRLDRCRVVIVNGNHDRYMAEEGTDAWRPSLAFLLKSLNRFYGRWMPEYPTAPKDWAWFRLFRFDNQLLGNLLEPARLVILATQSESLERDFKGRNQPAGTEKPHAVLTDLQAERISSYLRSQLPLPSQPPLLLLTCAHRRLSQLRPVPGTGGADRGGNLESRYTGLADCFGSALHLCGHDHDGTASWSQAPGVANTHQYGSVKAPWGFYLFELPNHYPDTPAVRPPDVLLFNESNSATTRYHDEAQKVDRRVEVFPTCPAGFQKYKIKGTEPTPPTSRFQSTLGKKNQEDQAGLKSYIQLFRHVPERTHFCPYPDVYTRYFPWIIDSAENLQDGPSDTLIVVHVGPFTKWLEEPMNSRYFVQQVKAAMLQRIAVFRIWLIPPPRETAKLTDYGFDHYDTIIPSGNGVANAVREAGIGGPASGRELTYSDAVEAILQPCDTHGAPLRNYTSMVLNRDMIAVLAGRQERGLKESANSGIAGSQRKDSFSALTKVCQQDNEWATQLRRYFAKIVPMLDEPRDHYRLFVGSAARRRSDTKVDHLHLGYRDAERREAVLISGSPRVQTS